MMITRKASVIRPHRTSGVQPIAAAGAPAVAPVRRVPIENLLSPLQRRQVASHSAELVDPTIEGDDAAAVVHVGTSRIALPSGTRVAAGSRGVMYALISDELHVLVESGSRVRELLVDDRLAAQLRAEHFDL